jgi:1-deoxyxylulose-5-phosphate synthase
MTDTAHKLEGPPMKHVSIGGLDVSRLGLGAMTMAGTYTSEGAVDDAESIRTIHRALDLGVTHLDTAEIYGPFHSEEVVGRALKGRRDHVVIGTKFGLVAHRDGVAPGTVDSSAVNVRAAVEGSLRRLDTDHIDLYQMHEPDPGTPIDETLAALDDLVRAGKVRYLGNSNFAGWQIADADWVASSNGRARFISAQNHYSLLERSAETEVVPACERFGLGLLPFFPLANGLLTGKYGRGHAPEGSRLTYSRQQLLDQTDFDQLATFSDFARARGLTEVEVAFSWLAAQPAVGSVIAGATRPEQVTQNAAAAGWHPTAEDLAELDEIFPREPRVALF